MKRFYLLWFILPAVLFGCRHTAQTEEVSTLYGNLYVRYLQENQQIKAEASFYQLDSAQQAKPVKIEGGVAFLGSGMGMRVFPNGQLIRYQYENKLEFPQQLRFKMQDLAGQEQSFTMDFAPIDTFALSTPIDPEQPVRLQLLSGPLSDTQELVFLFNDAASNAYSFSIKGPSLSDTLTLPKAELKKMAPGEYELYLVKKEQKTFDRPNIKAGMEVESYSQTRNITIN